MFFRNLSYNTTIALCIFFSKRYILFFYLQKIKKNSKKMAVDKLLSAEIGPVKVCYQNYKKIYKIKFFFPVLIFIID